jgi:hypothetical protein
MSRQKANYEPLYSCESKSYDNKFVIKSIRRREARQMAEQKETFRFCKACGRSNEEIRCRANDRGVHSMISKLRAPRHDRKSKPTITLGEVAAVAGTGFERGKSKTLDQPEYARRQMFAAGVVRDLEDPIELAVVKLDEWPLTGDDLAPRVSGISGREMARLSQIRDLRMMQARG